MSKVPPARSNIKAQKGNNAPMVSSPANTSIVQNSASVPNQQTSPIPTTQPTDSYIPTYLAELVPELRSYEKLLESERKIDVYLARKKIDLHQSISQWNNSKSSAASQNKSDVRYLRVFVSNIAEQQPWQDPENDIANATWTMRIEGRLLDDKGIQDPERSKFSSFLQAISVDFKKLKKVSKVEESTDSQDIEMNGTSDVLGNSASLLGMQLPGRQNQIPNDGSLNAEDASTAGSEAPHKPEIEEDEYEITDAVEWHYDPKNPVEFDGLDIKRPGSENVKCSITMQPKGFTGERLEYSPELGSIIGLSQGSLHEAVYSLYKYILMNELLVNDDSNVQTATHTSSDNTNGEKTMVQLNHSLMKLLPRTFSSDGETAPTVLKLSEILPLVNSHIFPIRPIKIDYTIRVDKASTYGELVFDLEVPAPLLNSQNSSPGLGEQGISLLTDFNKLSTDLSPELQVLESRVNTLQLQLNSSANKYQFYNKLAKNPTHFLEEYMASTANALKVLSGDEGFNEDVVRRSGFYKENESMLFENLGVLLANGRM